MLSNYLDDIVRAQKQGRARGACSVCSAHPVVLEAAMRAAGGGPVLIESTCNQVNQFGGYTGMTPPKFIQAIHDIADQLGFPRRSVVFGGDHLGPLPWQDQGASDAMALARALVSEYARAGYTKIHLDASMPCADDEHLSLQDIAWRTVDLAQVAERHGSAAIRYVIGSEVPTAGGAHAGDEALTVTSPDSALQTIEIMRAAFRAAGLESAWDRVIGLVVQPGVEFGDRTIHRYDRSKAAGLKQCIETQPGLIFEAHSTDYQDRHALREMVEDHFAILKVGPALTFAFREAVFALEKIEQELGFSEPSRISDALEAAMLAEPAFWKAHYRGNAAALRLSRRYSFSDRIRYYWADPKVQSALRQLLSNLESEPIPASLISQFLPTALGKIRTSGAPSDVKDLLMIRVMEVLEDYAVAIGSAD